MTWFSSFRLAFSRRTASKYFAELVFPYLLLIKDVEGDYWKTRDIHQITCRIPHFGVQSVLHLLEGRHHWWLRRILGIAWRPPSLSSQMQTSWFGSPWSSRSEWWLLDCVCRFLNCQQDTNVPWKIKTRIVIHELRKVKPSEASKSFAKRVFLGTLPKLSPFAKCLFTSFAGQVFLLARQDLPSTD